METLIKEFKMAKTLHNDFYKFCKANKESGYNFKNVYTEIDEDQYWYMLEVLPPYSMIGTAFLMSEFNKGSLVNGAIKLNNKYYVFAIDVHDFKECIKWFGNNR